MVDEHRLAPPDDGNPLADLDRGEIDAGRRQGQSIGGRVHAINQRPHCQPGANHADNAGSDQEEVAPCLPFVHMRRRGCHHFCHGRSSLVISRAWKPASSFRPLRGRSRGGPARSHSPAIPCRPRVVVTTVRRRSVSASERRRSSPLRDGNVKVRAYNAKDLSRKAPSRPGAGAGNMAFTGRCDGQIAAQQQRSRIARCQTAGRLGGHSTRDRGGATASSGRRSARMPRASAATAATSIRPAPKR